MFRVGTRDRIRGTTFGGMPANFLGDTKPWQQRSRRASVLERTSAEGFVFDSVGELRRWAELQLRERAGEIAELRRQVRFPLVDPFDASAPPVQTATGRVASYTVDFLYREAGKVVHEDFKGYMTRDAQIRIAVFERLYRVKVRISGKPRRGAPRFRPP